MSSITPFLLVATLVAAMGAATVSEARPDHSAAARTVAAATFSPVKPA